ncbi:GNAT family N-acetyltransferase, partial [Clostridioides difficile]|nr:GNAT family N-acetyltransferase [Clostridioides difficile]
MEYKVNDQELNASMFIPFVNRIWPGDYDMDKTQTALSKTLNITAYDDKVLVG